MLKSLVALLLSKFVKKTDTEFIAAQPMAGNIANRLRLYAASGNITYPYTAPSNGYVWVVLGTNIKAVYAKNNRSGLTVRLELVTDQLRYSHVFLPCAKGDTCEIQVVTSGETQVEGNQIYFIPSIGG